MSENKSILQWQDVRVLAHTLLAALPMPIYKIYGIPRGGINAALLVCEASNRNLILVDTPEEADAFIDDIIDSGKTLREWEAKYQKPVFALIDKTKGDCAGQWVVFPWESSEEVEGAEDNVRRLLQAIGEDPDREGLIETPKRFVKAFKELTSGYRENPADHLRKSFCLQDTEAVVGHYDEVILSGPLPFVSLCEHHLALFEGHAWIGYIPRKEGRVVGLSKLGRLLDGYARRLQVQERLTLQIANDIENELQPEGVAVVIRARHTCQCVRGIKKDGRMVTSALRGAFKKDPTARQELFQLISLAEKGTE
jgi:GTP cyclohydrolase I